MKFFFTFLLIALACFNISAQNRGLNFDGVDDYVQIDNPSRPGTVITVEAWFNPDAGSLAWQDMIDQGQYQWSIWNQGGTWAAGSNLYVELYNTTLQGAIVTYTLPASLANTWHHVAFTYDGANLKVYLDGAAVGQSPLTGSLPTTTGNYLFISGFGGTLYNYHGTMDELRIWDVARTQAEIQSTMFSELADNTPGLVAYYKFNQGIIGGNNAGITTLTDAVATPHDGNLANFALNGPTSNWVAGYPLLVALPLKIISFTAEKEVNSITLKWKAGVLKDISTFEIEKNSDEQGFSRIGSVSAVRSGTGDVSYTFNDDRPGNSFNYYRLKIIDDLGKITYSSILTIRMNSITRIAVLPNPTTNTLQLQTTQKGKFTIVIQDAWQRVVKKLQLSSSNSNLLTTNIDVSNLPKGVYFIRVADELIKFLKQ